MLSLGISQDVSATVAAGPPGVGEIYAGSDTGMSSKQDLWHYDESKLAFRGPKCDFTRPFVAVLGGSETFGRQVARPYPALLADGIGLPVANLGVRHAGVSLFSKERWILDIASEAEVTVIQILGAQNMSNRLYCVHPRRNDRFLTCSSALRLIYPDVDFAEINFTGHLLSHLHASSNERFSIVLEELRWAWVQRMRRIVGFIRGDVHLLWLSERSPDDVSDRPDCRDPMFVNRAMLDELSPLVSGMTEVVRPRPLSARAVVPFACHESDAPLHQAVADKLALDLKDSLAGIAKGPDRGVGAPGRGGSKRDQSFSINSGTAVKRSATSP